MNDDIFLIHTYVFEEEYYWQHSLRSLLIACRGNKYSQHVTATITMYPNRSERCFDTHYPFIINKNNYLAANRLINWNVERGYLTKTIYMRYMIDNKIITEDKIFQKNDCLIHQEYQAFPNTDVISVSTNGLSNKIKDFLASSFPNKSKYEL